MQLGHAARDVRMALGLSQRQAAAELGITAAHLCNIETGSSNPSLFLIWRYQHLWDVDIYVLAWCHGVVPRGFTKGASRLLRQWHKKPKPKGETMKRKTTDGVARAVITVPDVRALEKAEDLLADFRIAERGGPLVELAHMTELNIRTILQERGPAPTAPAEEPDADN